MKHYFWDFIEKRLREVFGLGFLALSIILAVALGTYNPLDNSFNTASPSQTHNVLGDVGSFLSDMLWQSFGVLAFLWVLVFVIWGGRLLSLKPFHYMLPRFLAALVALVGLGVVLSAVDLLVYVSAIMRQVLSHPCGVLSTLLYHKMVEFLTEHQWGVAIMPCLAAIFCSAFLLLWFGAGLTFHQLKRLMTFSYRMVVKGSLMIGLWIYRWIDKKPDHVWADLPLENEAFDPHIIAEDLESLPDVSWDEADVTPRMVSKTLNKKITVPPPSRPGEYVLPPVDLLDAYVEKQKSLVTDEQLKEQARLLELVLNEFGIHGEIEQIRPGPVVTLYELKPAPGIKTSRVISLADDIARSMSALSARIAVIPGQNVIGIELPNKIRHTVYLKDLLASADYNKTKCALPLILGQNIGGQPIIVDLTKMPHLLVAGTTGSGKSVSVNAMILSLLFKLPPKSCKFIMIDPKMLELSVYDDIPHLLTPVVTDPKKAVVALKWAVKEMENRYRAMSKLGVRNIDGFNERLKESKQKGEVLMRRVQTGFDSETGKPIFENQGLDFEQLPYIVVVVDEMADLMLVAGKEIEATIQRLAQMARAAGIHLIMATQRPSVDVITGTIKANFPTRISFQVTSKIDSRTILSEQGAEQLLGQGDMLYMAGGGRISRVHGPFVKDNEVERIVSFLKSQGEPTYMDGITDDEEDGLGGSGSGGSGSGEDATYQAAVEVITREGKVSTSFIQRHLQIGYNRAARIIEQMEKNGVISPPNHAGKREILM